MSRHKKTRTATRLCASCGQPFTWTSRNPRRRFCNPACKSRWWRASTNDTPATGRPAANTASSTTGRHHNTANVVDSAATSDAVTSSYDPYVAGYGTGQAPNAIQNCPNCHQPVAVINLLVTSAAAYVNTPSRSVTNANECRSV